MRRTPWPSRLFPRRHWPLDVVVYTAEEVRRFRNTIGTLLYTIEREGQLVYERS